MTVLRDASDRALLAGDPVAAVPAADPRRQADWRRLRGPVTVAALVLAGVGAVAAALGTVVAGQLAADPTGLLVALLALCVVGGAVLDTTGRTLWAGVVDRAEGRLRADLVHAALHQPLPVLAEQAVGEVLDRVDDDTHEVGTLLRGQAWNAIRTTFGLLPVWLVAGLTWWPAFLLLPVTGALVLLVVRPLLSELVERKVVEEAAWTDQAAALEEAVAAQDDLRTSLGQAHALRRLAELSATVHARFAVVLGLEARISRRAGLLLHALLAVVGVGGALLASRGRLSTAELVTLFLVTTSFVGQVDQVARQLPDLQAGLGALVRLRQLLAVEPEPAGGRALPDGPLALELRGVDFGYPGGRFALRDVSLDVPAGSTLALVGRTGSGKSTLASLLSRAVEPGPGQVLLGGVDVLELDLQQLRGAVGVVTQRTEVLAGTLADNLSLFRDVPRARLEAAVVELGLDDWVAGLPDGLDTPLGPGGTTLSAGESQLVAFARLLVRDVRVVVLDEATARMDPVTEARVVRAADRLLRGRTGVLVAHRLSTTARAEQVAVLEAGRVVQRGPRAELAARPGPFRDLLEASDDVEVVAPASGQVGTARRTAEPPELPDPGHGPSLARGTWRALSVRPAWGLLGAVLFLMLSLTGAFGVLTGLVWGQLVQRLDRGAEVGPLVVALGGVLLVAPLLFAEAIRRYPRWWVEVLLRVRTSVLVGQTSTSRLVRTPPGEVVARALDADRYARYADRWVDFVNGLLVACFAALAAQSLLAGGVLLGVMLLSALASALGSPVAGRSAAASSAARAGFGRSLVSALESARTVKLAGATEAVQAHLSRVDSGRVGRAVREHRVQAVLDGVPVVLVQCGVVAAWGVLLVGGWDLATALLVATTVSGFDWFGRVPGASVTTARFAGGTDLMAVPAGVDLVGGSAPLPPDAPRTRLQHLSLRGVTALHDDGTVGVQDVDLDVRAGELVLLLGQVGSGKSSLLAALAGLVSRTGDLRWNGVDVTDPEAFLRPGQVAHVAQVPRVLSGTFTDNVRLDHGDRPVEPALADARMGRDVAEAGGADALVGHRGVRLSGGQVQRLALARALATGAELVLADDVSSALDAATELELWEALRRRGSTVVGATSKRAALAQADRVVVLQDGAVADVGPWRELSPRWSHLAS
jgi:ATP-binding cassette, subfamily B, bacterial